MRFVLYGYAPTAQALKDDILMERAFLDTSVDRECCKEGDEVWEVDIRLHRVPTLGETIKNEWDVNDKELV